MRWPFPLVALCGALSVPVQALFETTYHSSSVVVQPFTILEKSPLYDPDNTNLFLVCPNGLEVAEPGAAIYKSNGELVWAESSFGNCYNFNYQTYDGQQYLTLWVGAGGAAVGSQMGFGTVLMMNSSYDVVMNVSAVNPEGTDLHEFNIVKPENKTVLVTAFHTIPMDLSSIGGPVDGWYSNDIIQEIDIATGAVLFNWTTFDHVALTESYNNISLTGQGFTEDNPFDAVHINSIDKDLEGNYLISARHTQTIYKIAANETILWRLGGKMSNFTALGKGTEFHFQHHVRWRMDETHISVFDDGGAFIATDVIIDEPVATGKYLKVDQEAMTVSLTKQFIPGPNRNYTLAEGSTEPYGDTVVVGYGYTPWTQAYSFDTEELLFSAVIGPDNASLWNDNGINNYRAFQTSTLEFTGHPKLPPNVSVTDGAIFVSWNGATHVASYTLLTGPSVWDVSKKVTKVPKSGFETKIKSAGSSEFIVVAALAANGTTLGKSAVYRTSNGTVASD
ncbi:ASST-domain-containing protein [Mycena maculata]|uniref:ASST-domain-containing protein n=1 Tax=Mycena maculata TaxID=230809 RepID=A0AAD7NUT7_9AGAR|nr:ASST-domain-containing protein [Mycena maculata]